MDFHRLIGPLTDPAAHGGEAADAFDLVIPSLPGHGFSMPLTTPGLDVPRHAEIFARLMRDVLGYPRFAVGGGDWGAAISNLMAHRYPERVIGLLATMMLELRGIEVYTLATRPGPPKRTSPWAISSPVAEPRTVIVERPWR